MLSVYDFVHVSADAHGSQRCQVLLEWDLKVVVTCPMWALANELSPLSAPLSAPWQVFIGNESIVLLRAPWWEISSSVGPCKSCRLPLTVYYTEHCALKLPWGSTFVLEIEWQKHQVKHSEGNWRWAMVRKLATLLLLSSRAAAAAAAEKHRSTQMDLDSKLRWKQCNQLTPLPLTGSCCGRTEVCTNMPGPRGLLARR